MSEQFLRQFHAEGSIPTPIEEIAEIKCGLDIIPLPGLRDLLEIDGFISSDLSCITVDQFILERRLNRYRFTLAHELGHLYLHRDIYSELKFGGLNEWKQFQREVDEADYNWLEYQGLQVVRGRLQAVGITWWDRRREYQRKDLLGRRGRAWQSGWRGLPKPAPSGQRRSSCRARCPSSQSRVSGDSR